MHTACAWGDDQTEVQMQHTIYATIRAHDGRPRATAQIFRREGVNCDSLVSSVEIDLRNIPALQQALEEARALERRIAGQAG
jgi:hypothetical protein